MKLFESFNLSGLTLSSRVIMAPLTRRRATRENVPVSLMAEYYGQRAGAGLIIAEGTSPSPNGVGYCNMPGIYNKEQLEKWKPCTKAVHDAGGKIFLQVMHTGRVGHPDNLPAGVPLLGPSAIPQQGEISVYNHEDKQPYPVPKEMSITEIETAIREFGTCSAMAVEAGFDGVEIHSAHGYLPNQFINKESNQRQDDYGGSIHNRLRFLLEVIDACVSAIGKEKVGLRISPYSYADTMEDPAILEETYLALIDALNTRNLAYLHLSHMGEPVQQKFDLWSRIREKYNGTLMLCGDFTKESAERALQENKADLIAFGRDFIANPDLVNRLQNNYPLMERDRTNWYTNDSVGYTDYQNYKTDK